MHNLLTFLTKYNHWLVFLVLEVVSGLMLFNYNSYQGSVWVSSANAVVGRVYDWQATVTHFFSLSARDELLTEKNVILEQENSRLRQRLAEMTRDSTDGERQEMARLGGIERVPAKVVSNSVSHVDNMMTIDRGLADGVCPDMGVVCGTGVVGVVYQSSDHYSVVLPLLNRRSRISCTIRGKGYFGYLTWEGGDPMRAYVEDIPRHAQFEKGDWLETSGYSAIFPQGISVGKIIAVEDSPDGMSYRLHVLLSTDFSLLRDVCVITDKSALERMRLERMAADTLSEQSTTNMRLP